MSSEEPMHDPEGGEMEDEGGMVSNEMMMENEADEGPSASGGMEMNFEDDIMEGDEIPPFANEENKRLDAEVKSKNRKCGELDAQVSAITERLVVLQQHLVNVQQELGNTQSLVDSKNKEMQTEEHMTSLLDRQAGRIKAEIVRLEKVVADYQEDALSLERYRRADEVKIRDLTQAIEKLTVGQPIELADTKGELNKEVTETQAAQIELDRVAEHFKKLHLDRHSLIKQWEDAVSAMRKRDSAIEQLGERYAEIQKEIQQKKSKLERNKAFLAHEKSNNKQLEVEITNTDRQLSHIRLELLDEKKALASFKDQCDVLRHQMSAEATEMSHRRTQLASLQDALDEKKHRLMHLEKRYAASKSKFDVEAMEAQNKENLARDAALLLDELTEKQRDVEKETKVVKDALFKASQELYQLREQEGNTLGEISGAQANSKTLQFQIQRLDQERRRQFQLMYKVDFESQVMQRKVARVSGERTMEEKLELSNKIENLEASLAQQTELWDTVVKQTRHLDAELRAAQRAAEEQKKENTKSQGDVEGIEAENNSLTRAVETQSREKEDVLVQRDILRLEVKKLRSLLSHKTEGLLSHQNRKEQLSLTAQTKEKEISVHKEVLQAQKRVCDEERHKWALELAERRSKINNLSAKFDALQARTKKEEGPKKSQAYYVIKAAQAQEELQRQGDELDAQVRNSEREVRALENTLAHLLSRNHRYKENFKSADARLSQDVQERDALETQLRAANDALFKKRKSLNRVERELVEDQRRLRELTRQKEAFQGTLFEMHTMKGHFERELGDQENNLDRAFKQLQAQRRAAADAGVMVSQQGIVRGNRVKRQQERHWRQRFRSCFAELPEVTGALHRVCQQRGLALPAEPLVAAQ
uniref:Coiled-coil domain-containing protein 39 n=1 Tax=Chromera velia CCMP2878 TaxID=1169474 RepID=A0A0G4G0L3_9ALVE|eukprot:Cvel_19562.t1-p1 / transcript=Cvel_19562.t1 / gene=Cvel_19562 / organism=Chromera_velia_CCMP2878 / gene_product=Coiled-coil domain-containing protein 39, putative / transcript_product=Coiled-coil domain-containing protein 39, putative / location=Cvel_scaffold1696:18186-25971(+) / protein_length=876 / sequence_SO=supercontig / SO=protein_coding / is_pseudo=false